METTKIALVTGASRGIGREVCIGLARKGYKIAAIARTEKDLKTLADEAGVSPANFKLFPLDVSEENSVTRCVEDIVNGWGRLDLLLNNAGIFRKGTLSASVSDLDELYKINLRGSFLFLQSVVPQMKMQKAGYIINIASISGKIGYDQFGAYASSKFGLVGMSQSLFHELTKEGIKVTTICPSWVATDMAEEAGSTYSRPEMIQSSDILSTIDWLISLSPSASIEEVVIQCSKSVS